MKIFQKLVVAMAFLLLLAAVIAYARGYRIDFQKPSLKPSGILAISSNPKAAKIFINGQLKGVTDLNITLNPGIYDLEIKRDGYTNFNRSVNLKGELVMSLDALLFPVNPSLSPLTSLGLVKVIPLDQTDRLLIFSESEDVNKDGIYLFDASKKTISLFPPLKLIVLKKDLPAGVKLKNTLAYFSPDYKQAIIEFTSDIKQSFLFSLDEDNKGLFDVSSSKQTLLDAWDKEKEVEKNKILETFPKEFIKVASDSFHIVSYSPDETKILYTSGRNLTIPPVITPPLIASNQTKEERMLKKDNLYLYDKKEDKNFLISNPPAGRAGFKFQTRLPDEQVSNLIQWYPDSKHLVYEDGKKIVVLDYDGSNKQVLYSGPFDSSFYTITSDGKLLILLNLNPENNKFLDLYLVGIR